MHHQSLSLACDPYDTASPSPLRVQELVKKQAEMELRDCTFFPQRKDTHARSSSVGPPGRLDKAAANSAVAAGLGRSASVGRGRPTGTTKRAADANAAPVPLLPPKITQKEVAVIYTKNVTWVQEREMRLRAEREKRAESELAECTFQPRPSTSDATIGGGDESYRGAAVSHGSSGRGGGPHSPKDTKDGEGGGGSGRARQVSHAAVGHATAAAPPPVPTVEVYKGVDEYFERQVSC